MTSLLLVAALGPAEAAPLVLGRYEVGAGVDAGGPLLFRDPADERLLGTRAVQYGARAGFRFGLPGDDPHRFGVAVGWHALARSGRHALAGLDPLAVYATGDDLELQLGLGARVALGGDRFRLADGRMPFGGPLATVEVRHAFLDDQSPLGVALGAYAEAVVGRPAAYSTAYAGVRLDLVYRKPKRIDP